MNSEKCNLNDECLKIFVKCTFPEIKTLDFKWNDFSDKFLQIIFEQKWNKLKEVDLNYFYYDRNKLGNRISKFTFLYPFITDEINKNKG